MSDEGQNSGQEKSHAPTQQKIQRAREQGDVPYSSEVTAAATYIGFYTALVVAGGWCISRIGAVLIEFFRRPHDVGSILVSPASQAFLENTLWRLSVAVAPLFGFLILAAIVSIIGQRAVAFAPSKLKPKLQRLSIIDNAKQKYGPQGIFEFFKSVAKLSAILAILLYAIKDRFLELPGLSALPPQVFGDIMLREAVYFMGLITIAAVAIAVIDLPWRRFQHEKRLMMTFEELKKESRETEGDPQLKSARRERASAIARNRMMADIPGSNVVIVNPLHYAVVLKWDRDKGATPVCVAKGVDEIAARIREVAATSGVPIRRDPPTARSIYSLVDIGEEIRREHFAAVAAAIHYADEIQRKGKMRVSP